MPQQGCARSAAHGQEAGHCSPVAAVLQLPSEAHGITDQRPRKGKLVLSANYHEFPIQSAHTVEQHSAHTRWM